MLRVAAAAARHMVADVVQRVRGARVLCERLARELDLPRAGLERHVLEDRAEHLRRREDVGLLLLREVDDLGVAAALEVEDAVAAPAMLIVADESAVGIGGQRRLAGARQTEEECGVPVLADVRGAVHREHALLREEVVHHGEHRLLELAGVACAADEDHALREVQHDERAGARAVRRRVGLELRRVQDAEVRREGREFGELRTDEHVAHEVRMPRVGRDIPARETVCRIGAAIEILDEELIESVEVAAHVGEQCVEMRLAQWLVHLAPVHIGLGAPLLHDELVVGRAARVRRRHRDEGAHVGELPLVPLDRGLHELGSFEVPAHGPTRSETLGTQACGALADWHGGR